MTPSAAQAILAALGLRIAHYRAARGIDLATLAERSGLPPYTLGALERGEAGDICYAELYGVAEALDVTPGDLVGDDALVRTAHDIATDPETFSAIRSGLQPVLVRHDDPPYRPGDRVHLREWTPEDGYCGVDMTTEVIYRRPATVWGLPPGLVLLTLRPLSGSSREAATAVPQRPVSAPAVA